mgnify:CR=1 FL=1
MKGDDIMTFSLTRSEPTLWEEIWESVRNSWTTSENVYFDNLNLGNNAVATVRNIIFGIFVGIIVASFIMIIDKRVLGSFVRKLLSEDCTSPDKAKTLYDLGFCVKYSVRNGVRRGSTLRSVVVCVEEEEYNAKLEERRAEYEKKRAENSSLPPFKETPYSVNADTDRFYIPEEKKYAPDMRFAQKGTNWLIFALIILISAVAFVALSFLTPEILTLLDDLAGLI